MTRPGLALLALSLAIGAAAPTSALADEEPVDPEAVRFKEHHRQLGAALQIPVGIRAVVTYDNEWCGQRGENENANAEACVGRSPQAVDLVFAYGVQPNLEAMLELRVGLERDFGAVTGDDDGPRLFRWAPGVKFYFSDAGTSKLFSTAQLAFDHTGYANQPGTDFFIRNVNGLQLDLHPSYGVYFFVAEQMAFRRWFWIEVEAGIGIQGRYP